MERRIIKGFYSEKIYDEVVGDSIKDNEELVDKIEEYMEEDDEWKKIWLSEGKEDYAVVFVNSYKNLVFLLWTIEDELYFIDGSEIPKNPGVAEWFVEMVANYLINQLFPPKKILDVEWAEE